MKFAWVAVLVVSWSGSAQTVRVVSEFQRIGPDGRTYSLDLVERPREILSPATARNAYATFRVVVEAPPGLPYTVHIGQNPESSCEAKIYQEGYVQAGGEWVPDSLTPLPFPVSATLQASQKAQTYLLDLFVPESTPAGRFRLELQLFCNDRWVIYPLEMRPRRMTAPVRAEALPPVPPLPARADWALTAPLEEFACGVKRKAGSERGDALTVRTLLARNARQDIMLAETRAEGDTKEAVVWSLMKAGGFAGAPEFCANPGLSPKGAEWWLRARDYIYQGLPVH